MKLTIIETGLPPEAIRDRYEGYPAMFAELFKHTMMFTSVDNHWFLETKQIRTK